MPSSFQAVALIVVNSLILIGVLLWSGSVTEKTLYDRYIVSFESTSLPVTDHNAAVTFYSEVLNFTPLSEVDDNGTEVIVGFQVPEKRKLFFKFHDEEKGEHIANKSSVVLVMKVRNGFEKLHKELVTRSKNDAQDVSALNFRSNLKAGHISKIVNGEAGEKFIVSDLDRNFIVFYKAKLLRF